jgi:pimeloyl-ACP methyl ester carboxylesterase
VERDVSVNGVRLHCVVEGEGPLVLLLHGFPETSHAWRKQIPALAGRFRVVAPDLRGYGESDKPSGIGAYRTPVLAEDVVGLVRAFGGERAHIVGTTGVVASRGPRRSCTPRSSTDWSC